MSAQHSNAGPGGGSSNGAASQQDEASATLGIGGPTSGEAGSTPTHETMAETGGSGGSQQTLPARADAAPIAAQGARSSGPAQQQGGGQEGAGTAATAIARGYQDTRSDQAGRLPTGLGTPETGANQDANDLAPPSRK